ncbi:MAG: protease pro-enzyme activation domain-containing protein, partial [Terracidiphilus sp.]
MQATELPADAEGGPMQINTRVISATILSISLVIPGFILCAAQAQEDASRAISTSRQHAQILSTQAAAPAGLKALGGLHPGRRLDLAMTLKLHHEDELAELLKEIYDPASPNYRRYLTVAEFTERFGPTVEDHEQVLAFARSNGLTVTHTSANRMVVDLSGAVEEIERSFGVKMQLYQHPTEARNFYAPDVEPSVDASLPVQGIWGLSDLHPLRPASDPRQTAGRLTPQTTTAGSGPGGTFSGNDLRAAYVPGVTLNGAGQTIGLFEAGPYNMADIQGYFASEGQTLSVPILNVLLDGMSGVCGSDCDDTEETLDIDLALALAPNLSAVVVYEGTSPADILNQMATDNLAQQLSCSYVWSPDPALYEPIFKEFAAQGQSFLTSSGDGGAYSAPGCSTNCWNSLFPAGDPYVTAVGGTELTTSAPGGAWQSETAWQLSGGGINDYAYAIASYQAPLINSFNQGSATLRNIPDVAAIASNVFLQANGAQGSGGGTSASAPVWASFMALANEQANGSPVGFLNPTIYALAQTANYSSDFHDIVTGNNDDTYSPGLFPAVAGYDLVTGLGSPNGQALIDAIAPASSGPNFALQSSAPTIDVMQGGQGTFQVTLQAANGFSGAVNLRTVVIGQPAGVTASLSQTSISGAAYSTVTISTTDGVSVPSVTVCVTGTSGGLTQRVYVAVTVDLPNLVETAVSAPPATASPNSTFSVTDTVENNGQAPAGSSVTVYYLSDATTKNGIDFLVGNRNVPALAAAASSTATATVTVPAGIWPNTPYYLLACANDTGAVAQDTTNNCVASSSAMVFSPPQTGTTTSLAVTSSSTPVSSVASGAVVTLKATVVAGTTPVSPGQVIFCEASAAYCTDIHLLGTAQLTSSGTAAIKIIPAIGTHTYRAVFAGTTSYVASASGSSALDVTGTHTTTTAIAEGGSNGNYTLTATVSGAGGLTTPSGSVSFLDTSFANASLGDATLAAGRASLSWL